MAVRAQFRGMSWPPAPNLNLKEPVPVGPASVAGSQQMMTPALLFLLGVSLLVYSYLGPIRSQEVETPPSPVPSIRSSARPMPSPRATLRPMTSPRPLVSPVPGAQIRPADLLKPTPGPYGYGYRIPETTRQQILAMKIPKGKYDPFINALRTPPPPKLPVVAPAPPPTVSLPPPPLTAPTISAKKWAAKPARKPVVRAPLVLNPDEITVQGILSSDEEAMVILNVKGEMESFRVGDMVSVGGKRLWVQSIDAVRLTVTLKDASGRKAVLKTD